MSLHICSFIGATAYDILEKLCGSLFMTSKSVLSYTDVMFKDIVKIMFNLINAYKKIHFSIIQQEQIEGKYWNKYTYTFEHLLVHVWCTKMELT